MAVEILRGDDGYDHKADYWSIGVIFYEMLAGLPPFYAENPMKVYNNILDFSSNLEFPELGEDEESNEPVMSQECWNLIVCLICEPEKRISSMEEFKQHPYFKQVDFESLRQQEAPFVPDLESETDTSYFGAMDTAQLEKDIRAAKQSTPLSSSPKDPTHLIGFTWKHFDEKRATPPPTPNTFERQSDKEIPNKKDFNSLNYFEESSDDN